MAIDSRISDAFLADNGFPLEPHLVVLALMGSHSHGTYLPPEDPDAVDDVDYMGFVVPPLEYHLGLPRWEHWRLQLEELDVVLYSLDKAVRLLLKSNPNVVGVLWLREDEYVHRHRAFDLLLQQRTIFSSQEAITAFAGYSADQLKRMEAFDIERMTEYETLTAQIGVRARLEELIEQPPSRIPEFSRNWNLPADTLEQFRQLHRKYFSGYMGEKRKAMIRRYQYDVKNAAHLIRLLRMGREFLDTGNLQVFRTQDADELKLIKRGGWTLEQVKAEAERLFTEISAAGDRSILPPHPDADAASALLIQLHRTLLQI